MLVGLLAVASLPVGYAVTQYLRDLDLLWTAVAAVPALFLGWIALVLARRVRARAALTLGGVTGEGTARVGRILGFLGIYLAVTAALAVAFYGLLKAFGA